MEILTHLYTAERVQTSFNVLSSVLSLNNRIDFHGRLVSIPIIVSGRIILNSPVVGEHFTCCYNEEYHKVLWRTNTNEWSKSPIVCDGILYIKGGDDFKGEKLYTAIYDIENGDCRSKEELILGLDQCAVNGKIFVKTFLKNIDKQTHILCFDAESLQQSWSVGDFWFNNFAASKSYIVLLSLESEIVCRNPVSGELLWETDPLKLSLFSSQSEIDALRDIHNGNLSVRQKVIYDYPSIYDDRIVVTPMYGNYIVGLDAKSGKLKWTVLLEYSQNQTRQAYRNEIYTGGGRHIEAYDMNTGKRTCFVEIDEASFQEKTNIRVPAITRFTVSETHIFATLGISHGAFFAINKQTGIVEWAHIPDEPIRSDDHPYICNGRIYYRTLGRLYIFEGVDGYTG